MVYKGRERIDRGKLKSFYDLPEKHQKIFSEIKNALDVDDVYVFGSFYHGFWDEFSDYDVTINKKITDVEKIKQLESTLKIKINVLLIDKKGEIKIP